MHGKQELNPTVGRERGRALYIGIYDIKGHAQVGWQLKDYWIKEFLQHSLGEIITAVFLNQGSLYCVINIYPYTHR